MHDSWNESQFSSLTTIKKKKHYLLCKRKKTTNQKCMCSLSVSSFGSCRLSLVWAAAGGEWTEGRGSCLTQAACSDDAVVLWQDPFYTLFTSLKGRLMHLKYYPYVYVSMIFMPKEKYSTKIFELIIFEFFKLYSVTLKDYAKISPRLIWMKLTSSESAGPEGGKELPVQ